MSSLINRETDARVRAVMNYLIRQQPDACLCFWGGLHTVALDVVRIVDETEVDAELGEG